VAGEGCTECQKKWLPLQRRATHESELEEIPLIVHEVLQSPGQSLDSSTRAFMEPRFGHDFSQVRVHTDAKAAESARAVNALAYTVNHNVVFGVGRYSPNTQTGMELLAHELTHVVQQSGTRNNTATNQGSMQGFTAPWAIGQANDQYEQEANRIANQVVQMAEPTGQCQIAPPITAPMIVSNPLLQRQNGGAEGGDLEEPQLTRSEEIALSRSSPGEFTGQSQPLGISLYNFGIDVAEPKVEHRAVLTELGHLLNVYAAVPVIVRVIGFADASGDELYNLRLSGRRADVVKDILQPLITQRVSLSAYGETNPAATNEAVSGRSRNRRVDIRFVANRPPTPQPLPRPRPVPPGDQPPIPQPPGPQPPGGGGGGDNDSFCVEHPLLCGIGITPFFLPLLCMIAPEICLGATCILAPELCLIPLPPPPPPPDPDDPDPDDPDDDGTHPVVSFLPAVRSPNTPTGMNDRIGLRDPVNVIAVVVNPPAPTAPITIAVDGTGQNGGDATINGQAQLNIVSTTPLEVQGKVMSSENFAYNPYLQLAAWWSNDLVGESNRFAVSSIAENWSVEFGIPPYGQGQYGYFLNADMPWVSDSGKVSDLNACLYVELVGDPDENGGMTGMGIGEVNDPANADPTDYPPAYDQHGTPFKYTRVTGYNRVKQLWRIRDIRSNSVWAPSKNSGFEIERRFERDPSNPRCWHLIVRKKGAAVTIGSMKSDAGSGDISHEFPDINCDPPPPPPPTHYDPPPTPTPPTQDDPPPTPIPTEPLPCDRAELGRRVDQCIEEAKQGAIDCTLGLIPFSGGWGGVVGGLDYFACLEQMKQDLLECDRRAKADTHCPDTPPPSPPTVPPPPPDSEDSFFA
jgi:outer membrane protein OmpA-like peptidoglycan-associated protein